MLKFKCLARASLMLLFFITAGSAFAQCITGPTTVCGGSLQSYTIDPADLPNGTVNTIWSITNGTLTPPTNMTGTDVTWGTQGTGQVLATFFKSGGQGTGTPIGSCTLDVQILPLPEVTLTPAFALSCLLNDGKVNDGEGYCENQDVPFSATGGGTYVWTAQGNATVPPTNGPDAVVHFTSPGNATVCVTVTSANGCVTELCKSYVVYARPEAGFSILSHPNATTQVDICRNESLTFLGTYSDPNGLDVGTYSWLAFEAGNPNNVIGGGNQQNFTQQFGQPGDYVVVLTVTNCLGCSDEHSILVHVNPFAGPEITCPSVVCQSNEPVLYCAPESPGCTSPTWSVGGGTFQQSASSPNCIEVTWSNPPASGYGTVTLSCSNALCPIPTTVELPIIPQTPVIQGPTLICDNQLDDNIYSLPYWPGTQYTWSTSPGAPQVIGSSNPQTPNIFSVDLDGFNGTFTVSAVLNNVIAGCTANTSLDVTVQDYNIVTDPPGPYCFGLPNGSPTFTIVPTPTPAGFQIKWTISSPNSTWNTLGAVDDPALGNLDFQAVFGGAGNFEVKAEIVFGNNAQTCDGLQTQVTIDPPVPPITDVTGRQSICPGLTYSYTANPLVNGATYEWQAMGGTVLSPTSRTTQVAWANAGPYSLRVRCVVNGCFSDWYPLTITPLILPDVDFTEPLPVCPDVPYTYTANDLNLDQYNWTAFGGSIISGLGTPEVQVIWHQSNTTPRLRLTGFLCGMSNQEIKNITLLGQDAEIEGPSPICQYVNGTYSVVQPDPGATYTWFVDNNQLPQTGPSVTLQFQYVGQVTIRVRIENYMGCPGIVGLEFPVEVTPNPKQFITQSGFLKCNKKGTVILTTSIPANNPGSTFSWYHLEGSPVPSFVPVGGSAFSNFYTPNGASLTVHYHPSFPGVIGTFKVVINEGSACPSEAFYTLQCLPYDIDPNPSPNVVFTNWEFMLQSNQTQQIDDCGMVFVEGTVSPTCLINSFFFVLNGGNGLGFSNPVQVADVLNPSALIGPFTAPGVYQVALVGVYDCDGHGPNPPVAYADIREITIPLTTNFVPRVTCVQGQPGTFTIDLLNTTDYLPQFDGNIQWTWTTGGPPPTGTVISNNQNTSFTAAAGQTVTVCLTASTQVLGDENPPVIHQYACTLCQDVVVPANLTVGIGGDPTSSCSGSVGTFQALVTDPNQVISYEWTFVLPSLTTFHSTVVNPTFGFPSGGDYTLTLEVLFANGCRVTATRTFSITQNTLSFNILSTNQPCGAKQLSACDDPSCLGFNFLWNTVPPETTPSIIVSQSGYYSVTVTDPATGCSLVRGVNAVASSPFNGSYYGTLSQCKGEDDLELLVPVTPGFKYTFSGLGLTITLNANNFTPPFWNVPLGDVSLLAANNYPFTVTVADNTGNPCNATLSGTLVVRPLPAEPTFTVKYYCDPFRAVLQANQPVSWYQNATFIAFGSQITVFGGGSYSAVSTNQFGCASQFSRSISGPLSVDILTGCYCIEPEVIQNGLAVLSAPGGGPYDYWAWFQAGNLSPLLSCTTATCSNVQPLVLQAGWEGDITLFVKKVYTNSDGTKTTCSATSDVFCWHLGPCDSIPTSCRVPEATTRTIACIEDYGTYSQYHIHWDFVDNGTTHPCNFPQNLGITGAGGNPVGQFVMIDYSLINGYWHFEGIFNLNASQPEPFDICWQIPFCLNSTGEQCGIASVCPTRANPQHDDDVLIDCYDHELPYCEDIDFNAVITCDNDPTNGATHLVTLTLSATIDATPNTTNCPNFSFYITSVTGTLPGGLIRVDVPNVPPLNGQQTITATVPILWYDQIGMDYICFQVILAHNDHCWPNDGNICSKRFCFDASQINCDLDRSPYRFTARCSREQGDGGVLYDYTVEFLNESSIQKCDVQNNNPNGFNTVLGFLGNQVTGTYLSYNGSLDFNDVFIVNTTTEYPVEATLPPCDGRGGDRSTEQDGMGTGTTLHLMPNPTSGQVLFSYSLSESSAAAEHELVVINALGVVQQRFNLSQFGASGAISYDASGLPNGVYQVGLLHRKQAVSVQRMVVLKDK